MVAVAVGEPLPVAIDQATELGIREPMAVDTPGVFPECWSIPDDELLLYDYFSKRVGDTGYETPYPLHIILAPGGKVAYASRVYDPDAVLAALRALVDGPTAR